MPVHLVEDQPGADFPCTTGKTSDFTGSIEKVTSDLSGEAIHDAEADTRHGLSTQ